MERTNGELTLMLEALEQKMDEKHEDIMTFLTDIKAQTTKTNGRVSALERWQFYVKGACAVIILLLVPIAIYFIQQTLSQASLHDEVQQAVTDAINSL
jgi:uncharacterized membrane protein YukC